MGIIKIIKGIVMDKYCKIEKMIAVKKVKNFFIELLLEFYNT